MLKYVISALLVTLALLQPGTAAEESAPTLAGFVRTVAEPVRTDPDERRWRWIRQTSVRTLRHPQTRRTITLLSMHHLGRKSYYAGLEQHLRSADVILREGPSPSLPREKLPLRFHWFVRWRKLDVRLFELSPQIDWERAVTDSRWVVLDLPIQERDSFLEARGATFPEAQRKWIEKMEKWLGYV